MTTVTKILLIILAAVFFVATVWLGVLYVKINRLNADIARNEAIIALKDKNIIEANAAIEAQNGRIETYKLNIEKATAEYKIEKERIGKRYEYLLANARKKQLAEPTCENTLDIIEKSQLEFLYE